jgi:ATP-dependent helicase/nuclease subunit B
MTAIADWRHDDGPLDGRFWPALAQRTLAWLGHGRLSARDAVLLLPHAGLLAPARAGFAQAGGWQPRIETPATLAASQGPPATPVAGALSGDATLDRLNARALLLRQPLGVGWRARDPRAFDDAVARMADTAAALWRAAHERPPAQRAAWWSAVCEALPAPGGPGAIEALLARVALAWAAEAAAPSTDVLWSLQSAAWIGVAVAGESPLISALLEQARQAGAATWRIDTDPALVQPFDPAAALPPPRLLRCDGAEQEAAAAALAVLEAIDRAALPVALIALDRRVVRRVRALLDRAGVTMHDETGWALSTTRAAARLMAALRAGLPGAGRDALVEALKEEAPRAADALEDAWRRERTAPEAALQAADALRARLERALSAGRRSIAETLDALRAAVPLLLQTLAGDDAGRQVLAALQLDAGAGTPAWQAAAGANPMEPAEFVDWVAAALEATAYLPAGPARPQVVITTLARAALRPFGAVVCPACDDAHLGAGSSAPTLLPEALTRAFGIADATQRRERETLAFAQLLRAPALTLLRRAFDADEPLARSPLVERALLARSRAGAEVPEEQAAQLPRQQVQRRPLSRPAPSMQGALPERLSATTVDALRDCPYRFFARVALGLVETTELDAALDRSDHGRWLHAVLHRFHGESAGDEATALQRLLAAADAVQAELGLDAAAHLPFRAGFDAFAERYLAWWDAHHKEGWRYVGGELERRAVPPTLGGVALEGRLDRLDRRDDGALMLIDYKTGNADALRERVKQPLEDTQLAFYAALLHDAPAEPPPRAIYLALSEQKAPQPIEHVNVAQSAAALVEGLADDLDALRAGQGAAALGEGRACTYCAARGLCRRDHWSE